MAIIRPLKPRMGRRATLGIAGGIWVLGSFMSLPMLLFFTTAPLDKAGGDTQIVCYPEWPDGPAPGSQLDYIYSVVLMVVTYFVPVAMMTFTYARIGTELWGSQSIGECTQRQVENIRSKRRVVKMMIVVVTIFVVCWLPTHIYFIVLSNVPSLNQSEYIQELYLGIYWLAMSSTMYNPIIYFWMNSRFRRGFKQFFSWCPFVHVPPETLSRREAVTSRYSYSGSPEAQCRIIRNGMMPARASAGRLPPHGRATVGACAPPLATGADPTGSTRVLGSTETVTTHADMASGYSTFRGEGGRRWRPYGRDLSRSVS